MLMIQTKFDPLRSVQEQAKRFRNEPPAVIHQHPGRLSKIIPGVTTDKLPIRGNYAKTTVKL